MSNVLRDIDDILLIYSGLQRFHGNHAGNGIRVDLEPVFDYLDGGFTEHRRLFVEDYPQSNGNSCYHTWLNISSIKSIQTLLNC